MNEFKVNKLISQHKNMSEFKDADKIISYLQGDDQQDISDKLKLRLQQYKLVQSLRMRYKRRAHIIAKLKAYFEIDSREASIIIADAEYVFGKVLRIDRDFEKHYMLEISKKNIEIAIKSGDTVKITKALLAHQSVLGPDPDDKELPDFGMFEAHHYTFQLPKGLPETLQDLLSSGAIDISKLIPSQMLKAATRDAQDVTDLSDEAAV